MVVFAVLIAIAFLILIITFVALLFWWRWPVGGAEYLVAVVGDGS